MGGNDAEFETGKPYKSYKFQCLEQCPRDTKEAIGVEGLPTCVTCKDCPKLCMGGQVTSLDELRDYEACTIITGDLSIQLSGSKFFELKINTFGLLHSKKVEKNVIYP